MSSLGLVTLLVRDYDEAVTFFVASLGFVVAEDTPLADDGRRWVVVRPAGTGRGAALLLARADGAAQTARVGDQLGGRVGFFLETSDFAGDHARMLAAGVRFLEEPRDEAYAIVAVFLDLYGNRWDLLQPKAS